MKKETDMHCSFCGKTHLEVKRLVTSPDGLAVICDECISACKEILSEDDTPIAKPEEFKVLTPNEIKEKLDEFIIGQDQAKKTLSVAVYNHYKRIKYFDSDKKDDKSEVIDLDKSNVLMMGPTGSGKTLLCKTLAKILDVPFAQSDATTLTESGYVGEDVENILLKLIQNADYDIKKAERGIIYVDEIDKLTGHKGDRSISRDVGGEGVQQGLLKIVEGTISSVPTQGGRKNPRQEMIKIDTTNILFICGGAFVGLKEIIADRKASSGLGFNALLNKEVEETKENLLSEVQPEDLVKFGLIPEFIGRMPVVVALDDLLESDLIRILTEPRNALTKQYKLMLGFDNVDLEFTDDALIAIAKKAIALKTGARGLRNIMENIMMDIMFKVPSDKDVVKVIVDKDSIISSNPTIIRKAKVEEDKPIHEEKAV